MKSTVLALGLVFGMSCEVLALPTQPVTTGIEPNNGLLVEVATKAQRNAAFADCKRRFGKRLVTVKFTKTQYSCQYRTAAKSAGPSPSFAKSADKTCRAQGMRFLKIINNSKSGHTNIMCVR
jgi:hypothetical protein